MVNLLVHTNVDQDRNDHYKVHGANFIEIKSYQKKFKTYKRHHAYIFTCHISPVRRTHLKSYNILYT